MVFETFLFLCARDGNDNDYDKKLEEEYIIIALPIRAQAVYSCTIPREEKGCVDGTAYDCKQTQRQEMLRCC